VESRECFLRVGTILNPGEELRNNHEIDDQGRCKKRVLANGVHRNGVASTHHEFGMILIHSDLGVADGGDVFDDDAVIDLAADVIVEENLVGCNDIVDYGGFADLLGAELTGCRQVLAIVVT